MTSKEEQLIEACKNNNIQRAIVLIPDPQVNINYKNRFGNSPLYIASMYGNKFIVDMLLKNGAEVNIENDTGLTPLTAATRSNKPEIIELLRTYNGRDGSGATRAGKKRNKKSNKRRKTIRKKRKTFKRK